MPCPSCGLCTCSFRADFIWSQRSADLFWGAAVLRPHALSAGAFTPATHSIARNGSCIVGAEFVELKLCGSCFDERPLVG